LKLIEQRKKGATRSYRPEGGEVAALMIGDESENTEIHDIIVCHKKKGLCDTPIPRVGRRHCDVYTQVGNTLTYIR